MTRSAGGIGNADAARSEPSPVGDATTSVGPEAPNWTAEQVAGWMAGALTRIVATATEIERAVGAPLPWLAEAEEALTNYDRWYVSRNALTDDQADPAPVTNGPDFATKRRA